MRVVTGIRDFSVQILPRRYRSDVEFPNLFREVLRQLGVDLARTYWNAYHLGTVPSGKGWDTRQTRPLALHRDTWGANLICQ